MPKKPEEALKELTQIMNEASLLSAAGALLGWDERTYMPHKGGAHRANQLALLAGMVHDKATSPRVGELLAQVEGTPLVKDPLSATAVNIREIRRFYDKQTKVPKKLVEEIAHAETTGQGIWVEARKKSDFKMFQPSLEKMIDLKKQYAEAVGYEDVAYDALLDDYEPYASTKSVTKVLGKFREELVPLVAKITGSDKKPNVSILEREYPVERQRLFGEMAAALIGFEFDAGRLDTTAHPFCTGIGPGDTRITTRFNPNHFGQALVWNPARSRPRNLRSGFTERTLGYADGRIRQSWGSMNRNRACGRIWSVVRNRSGSSSSHWRSRHSHESLVGCHVRRLLLCHQ